jgi:hypothetical protein
LRDGQALPSHEEDRRSRTLFSKWFATAARKSRDPFCLQTAWRSTIEGRETDGHSERSDACRAACSSYLQAWSQLSNVSGIENWVSSLAAAAELLTGTVRIRQAMIGHLLSRPRLP